MIVYIQNLSREVDEARLREIFAAHGAVAKVDILKDKETGVPVGIAFVEMPEKTEGEAAIKALNGKEFGGMALVLKEGLAPEERAGAHGQGGAWSRKGAPAGPKGGNPKGGAGYRGEGGPHAGAVRRGGQRGA